MTTTTTTGEARHIPVMLAQVLEFLAPSAGELHLDATFGAGGYTRGILDAAPCRVFAIDRDPEAIAAGEASAARYPGRLTLLHGRFSDMEELLAEQGVTALDGVVLDIGVSSMQIDEPARGFSFAKDGPLDMRMSRQGPSAADVVNGYEPAQLTRIIGILGEEHKARAIARSIAAARPIATTLDLAAAVERATGRQRPGDRIHPATRTFQALRIFVNRELDELAEALSAAERLLKPGGRLVAVTFHSLEDRILKRFLTERSGHKPLQSRHLPEAKPGHAASFELLFKGHAHASDEEIALNPRARSAKLRAARRTEAPAFPFDPDNLGLPRLAGIPPC